MSPEPVGSTRAGLIALGLFLALTFPVVAQERGDSEYGFMVEADGVDETFYTCTACHSEMIVVQQGKTREGWDKLLHWMVAEQGMRELEGQERDTILDYLAANYNTDRPNFPRP